jgi:hypothetical protein
MPNITQWASAGLHSVQVAQRGASGFMAGFAGLTTADTDQQSSMRLLIGGVTAPTPLPQSNRVYNRGRDGYIKSTIFNGQPNEFAIAFENYDGDLAAMLNNETVFTVGEWDFIPEGGSLSFQDSMWLIARHAQSKEADSDNQEGYENLLIYSVSGRVEAGNMDFQAPGAFNVQAVASPAQKTHFGTTCLASFGKQTVYTARWFSEYPCSMTCFIGDNSEDDITLGFTPISTAKTKAYNFGTGGALTVSSVNASTDEAKLSAAPGTGAVVIVVYETMDI